MLKDYSMDEDGVFNEYVCNNKTRVSHYASAIIQFISTLPAIKSAAIIHNRQFVCCDILTEKLKSSLREKKINVDDFQVESNPLLHYQPNLKVNYGAIDKVMLNIQLFASKSHINVVLTPYWLTLHMLTHRTRDG